MSVNSEIVEAVKLIRQRYTYSDTSDIYFSRYAPIYLGTNENQKGLLEVIDVSNQNILCPTSGGDFALNCLANNAKSVSVFDIDTLAKHLLNLKIGTILTYPDCQDFISFFTFSNIFLSFEKFKRISLNLPDNSYQFWKIIYEEANKIYSQREAIYKGSLLRHEQTQTKIIQSKFNIYYNQANYEYLRERLKKENIHTYDCGLMDLANLKLENSIDFLYLSNILQYYEEIPELQTQGNVHNFLRSKIIPLLKEEGLLGVCYGYYGYDFNIQKDVEGYKNICLYLLEQYPEIYGKIEIPAVLPPNEKSSLVFCKRQY